MSIGIGAAASFGTYALPVKAPGPTHSVDPAQAAHQAVKTQAKVAAAQETLANANSIVDQDKRNHSPGCVACERAVQ